jgi:hypothetical protein
MSIPRDVLQFSFLGQLLHSVDAGSQYASEPVLIYRVNYLNIPSGTLHSSIAWLSSSHALKK